MFSCDALRLLKINVLRIRILCYLLSFGLGVAVDNIYTSLFDGSNYFKNNRKFAKLVEQYNCS